MYNNPFKDKHLSTFMDTDEQMKIAVIAGASHALQYKQKHIRASDEETIQYVAREVENILSKIDAQE